MFQDKGARVPRLERERTRTAEEVNDFRHLRRVEFRETGLARGGVTSRGLSACWPPHSACGPWAALRRGSVRFLCSLHTGIHGVLDMRWPLG